MGSNKKKLASVSGLCWCLAFSKSRQGSKEVATEGHKVVAFFFLNAPWGWFISNNKKRSPPRISRSPRSNFQVYMAELIKAQEVEEIHSEVGGFFHSCMAWGRPTVEPGCFSGAAAYKCSAHRHSVKDETKRINWGNKCKNDKHSKLIEVLQLAQLVSYKNSM